MPLANGAKLGWFVGKPSLYLVSGWCWNKASKSSFPRGPRIKKLRQDLLSAFYILSSKVRTLQPYKASSTKKLFVGKRVVEHIIDNEAFRSASGKEFCSGIWLRNVCAHINLKIARNVFYTL